MKRRSIGVLVIVFGLLAAGCAPLTYQIQVNGYTNPEIATGIFPGSSFFVIENKDAQNPLLEREIKTKINKLLEGQGYRISPFEKADCYLLFSYGIGQPRTVTVVMPDYYPGEFGFYPYYPPGRYYSFLWPGFVTYVPYTETIYDKWLLINVVEGKYYREKGQFRTLWVGDARSSGPSADLRTAINYLLLADFKEFGKNTGKAVKVEIEEQDLRIKQLERVQ
jgi:hypothetical protein